MSLASVVVCLIGLVPIPPQDASRDQPPNWIDRQRARLSALKDLGITPKVDSVVSGSGLAFGVELRRPQLFGPLGASFETMWSIRAYHAHDLRVGDINGADERVELRPADSLLTSTFEYETAARPGASVYLHARYRVYPRVDFFGLNEGASRARRSDYALSGPSFDLVAQWQPTPRLGFSARGGVLSLSVGRGSNDAVPDLQDAFTSVEAPGFDRRNRYVTVGIGGVLDGRRPAGLSTQGASIGVAVWRYHPIDIDVDSEAGAFTRLIVDGRQLHELAGPAHVLALAGLASLTSSSNTVPPPFYLQSTLGGSKTLRGLGSYRLRGPIVLHASAEYRWRVHRRIELAGFADAGTASDSLRSVARRQVEVTPGAGIRILTDKDRFVRVDWGVGPDGHRFIFTVGGPF